MGPANIEDCLHTLGVARAGRRSGNCGFAVCFSTQTHKPMNSDEGDLPASDDVELAARTFVNSSIPLTFSRKNCEHISTTIVTCLTTLSDEGLFGDRPPPETSPVRTKSTAIVPATARIDAETSVGSDR